MAADLIPRVTQPLEHSVMSSLYGFFVCVCVNSQF